MGPPPLAPGDQRGAARGAKLTESLLAFARKQRLHPILADLNSIVADMSDQAGLSLPITGAIKELVKEARRIKVTNPPNWTGNKPVKYT